MRLFSRFQHLYTRFKLLLTSDPVKVAELWRKRGVEIGPGTFVYRDVIFGRGGADPITVGKDCTLTGCTILGHDASTNQALGLRYGEPSMIQPVEIGDNCFVGHGAIVLMGVKVGHGAIIGAGAVVTSDVPSGAVVAGNPARVICTVAELVERRKQIAAAHPEYFPVRPRVLG